MRPRRAAPIALLAALLLAGDAMAEPGESAPPSEEPVDEQPADEEPDGTDPDGAPAGEGDAAVQARPGSEADEARMRSLADRYYAGIGSSASAEETERALEAMRFMLEDGVSLERIAVAVDRAIVLAGPGRRTPFEVAVPLRVAPAETPALPSAIPATPPPPAPADAPRVQEADPVPARSVDPETEARWAEAQERLKEKRARLRLYRQWQDRTRLKRAMIGIGAPMLAAGYAAGFAGAGVSILDGTADHAQAWLTAIPLGGGIAFMAATEGVHVWPIPLSALQGAGLAFVIIGIAQKVDWPYDRDPTALRVRRPRGPDVTLSFQPGPTGGAIVGRW